MPPLVVSRVHQPSNQWGLPRNRKGAGLCGRDYCSLGRYLQFFRLFLTYEFKIRQYPFLSCASRVLQTLGSELSVSCISGGALL